VSERSLFGEPGLSGDGLNVNKGLISFFIQLLMLA
jgi:hypothetical protein